MAGTGAWWIPIVVFLSLALALLVIIGLLPVAAYVLTHFVMVPLHDWYSYWGVG